MEETCKVLVKMRNRMYQVETATWARGTPRFSAGPCSRTPWCWPRLSDSPGGRNMQNIITAVRCDVPCVVKCKISNFNRAWVCVSFFYFFFLWGTRGGHDAQKPCAHLSTKPSRNKWWLYELSGYVVSSSTVLNSEVNHWSLNSQEGIKGFFFPVQNRRLKKYVLYKLVQEVFVWASLCKRGKGHFAIKDEAKWKRETLQHDREW